MFLESMRMESWDEVNSLEILAYATHHKATLCVVAESIGILTGDIVQDNLTPILH